MTDARGADLGLQCFTRPEVGAPLSREHFHQPEVVDLLPYRKPSGGLWTSTWDDRFGSAWVQWCVSEEFRCPPDSVWADVWLLKAKRDARVFVIDSYRDLAELVERYPHRALAPSYVPRRDITPHWLKVASDYDAVSLTDAGQSSTHLSYPLDLYGWDCESTLWLRWMFESVERIEPRAFAVVEALRRDVLPVRWVNPSDDKPLRGAEIPKSAKRAFQL
jgi:hypothetical protein